MPSANLDTKAWKIRLQLFFLPFYKRRFCECRGIFINCHDGLLIVRVERIQRVFYDGVILP